MNLSYAVRIGIQLRSSVSLRGRDLAWTLLCRAQERHLEVKDGYAWASEKPGWDTEVDEALAAKHPITDEHPNEMRTPDGSVINGTGWEAGSNRRRAA
jgi:hypothetical protein